MVSLMSDSPADSLILFLLLPSAISVANNALWDTNEEWIL